MSTRPRILKRELIAATEVFKVEQLDLQFASGARRRFERILAGERGAVLVVPMLDEQRVLLIREYAAGSDRYELAFPKGRIEAGEDPLSAADREMREEVGYGARKLEVLRTVALAPGYIQHRTHLVLARDLFPSRLPGDEPEPIELVPWSLRALGELLDQQDFTEARSILALLLALRRLDADGDRPSTQNP
jgi:ADP-ribose diphosphatase